MSCGGCWALAWTCARPHSGPETRGGSGVVALPCGAGKTIVGMGAMNALQTQTLILTTNPNFKTMEEEIFGPVLSIIPYEDEDDAVRIANDTPYGLSGYVSCADLDKARSIASRMRTGMVHINGAWLDSAAPFGGYKQSGNGREWGIYGLEEFLETKAVPGYDS